MSDFKGQLSLLMAERHWAWDWKAQQTLKETFYGHLSITGHGAIPELSMALRYMQVFKMSNVDPNYNILSLPYTPQGSYK